MLERGDKIDKTLSKRKITCVDHGGFQFKIRSIKFVFMLALC